jgi:hypothetical protein
MMPMPVSTKINAHIAAHSKRLAHKEQDVAMTQVHNLTAATAGSGNINGATEGLFSSPACA